MPPSDQQSGEGMQIAGYRVRLRTERIKESAIFVMFVLSVAVLPAVVGSAVLAVSEKQVFFIFPGPELIELAVNGWVMGFMLFVVFVGILFAASVFYTQLKDLVNWAVEIEEVDDGA